jgi:hypothetical protein
LAIETIAALALPPAFHKCIDTNRHSTALHKNASYCEPFLDIVDNYFFVPAERLLSDNYEIPSEANSIQFKFSIVNEKDNAPLSRTVSSNSSTDLSDEKVWDFSNIQSDNRSIREIIRPISSSMNHKNQFSLIWKLRSRRNLNTNEGKIRFLNNLYGAVAVLLGCYTDFNKLNNFFQDKTELLKDFVYMIRSGPGLSTGDTRMDDGSSHYKVPLYTRTLAIQCLCALVGSRDTSTASVLGRFSWVQYDLGVQRGQYMGLLPCSLRQVSSSLISINSTNSLNMTPALVSEAAVLAEWLENLLMLTTALVNMTSSLPVLTDNGFIQCLLSLVMKKPFCDRSSNRLHLDTLVLQVLDSAIGNHIQTLATFKELNGIERVLERLYFEMDSLCGIYHDTAESSSGMPSKSVSSFIAKKSSQETKANDIENAILNPMPLAQALEDGKKTTINNIRHSHRLLIHHLISIMASYFHDDRKEGAEHRQVQIVKSSAFAKIITRIFANAKEMTSLILAPALSLMNDICNNDVAPPGVVTHFYSTGISLMAITATLHDNVTFDSDLLLSLTNFISSIALTQDGLNLIKQLNPFNGIFKLFFMSQHYTVKSGMFGGDLACLVGGNLEELIRHHPDLLPYCLRELTHTIHCVVEIASKVNEVTSDVIKSSNIQPDVGNDLKSREYVRFFHYLSSLLVCLESLLLRRQNADEFMTNFDGINLLLRVHEIALGPPRLMLASLQCAVNPTNFSIGHLPIINALSRCFSHMWEANVSNYFNTM